MYINQEPHIHNIYVYKKKRMQVQGLWLQRDARYHYFLDIRRLNLTYILVDLAVSLADLTI